MPNDLQSLFDRNIGTFMDRLTAENYKPQTIKAYRVLLTRLVSRIEAAGISLQDLTAQRAAELVRNDARNRREPNKCQNIARRFVAHLITSRTVPAPVATRGQIARASLRVDYEEYLARQIEGRHGRGPRIHDLRHSFAARTMIDWYRSGKDPAREMIKLTTWPGHANPDHTYWYIEAVPDRHSLNERQVWFLLRVGPGDRYFAEDLAAHWQVSERTAKRDIAILKDWGLIQYVGTLRRGHYIAVR